MHNVGREFIVSTQICFGQGARLYFLKLKFDQAQSYFIILPITCVLKYSLGSFAVLRDCQHLPNIF